MLRYKAGYKFVDGGVHAQILDFPAVITSANDLPEARHLLTTAWENRKSPKRILIWLS